ncbi:MAG: cellulase family glycosylhydrolase [Pyrinomonadaceae bacterium]|nr:cellulase family glycosylhydrolase [Pyrinomonadaceae bacterium]
MKLKQFAAQCLLLFALLTFVTTQVSLAQPARPISLHPVNPHYFLFRGKPTILITSAEHYGAVMNLDFDYVKYLDELQSKGMNNTRVFTGSYVEPQGAFNIERNTMAPAPNRYITPWARSLTQGYANGGNKFDLTKWDAAYFRRLKDFVAQAGRRGVIVEVNLFCPFYEEIQWKLSPQNAINNVNDLGTVARTDVYTLDKHGGLLAVHDALTRKVVAELKNFDNVYYEICNEPYFGGVTLEWQHHIAEVIAAAEKSFPFKHLISQNVANGSAKIERPHPAISVFNFHYATPPDTVALNYALNKPIGDNETGFRGTDDFQYRREAWDFIIAGGALYNNLDYSFAVGHEDGTFPYPKTQPGGGNPGFRNQLRILKEFINGFDFIRMKPDNSVLKGELPAGVSARALVKAGQAYAIYICPKVNDGAQDFSVKWSGRIEPKYSETYTFYTFSNDGVRLSVNGQPVITNWTDHSGVEDRGMISLSGGRKYEIKLDYYQAGGGSAIKLYWSSDSQKKEIIPQSQLTAGGENGLRGSYYSGKNFDRPMLTRTDPTIDFEWTNTSPFAAAPQNDATKEQTIELKVALSAGTYKAEWINTKSGRVDKAESFTHSDGDRALLSPTYSEDIALRIKKELTNRGGRLPSASSLRPLRLNLFTAEDAEKTQRARRFLPSIVNRRRKGNNFR